MTEVHPLTIIGSGPAAWTAAIYAARAALSPVVVAGEQSGGQLMLTTKIENYPGFEDGILGPDLMAAMRRQAQKHGVEIIDKNATGLQKEKDGLSISLISPTPTPLGPSSIVHRPSSLITAKAVILATGAVANTLKLPGEDRLMGRGVGTCAVCDAPFYKGKDTVFVIGGGDSAAEEAGELAKFVNKVVILVRKDTMRASAIMLNRIKTLQNVEIWYKSQAKEFLGEKRLERVKIVRDGKEEEVAAAGVFYAIGHTPATAWLKDSGVKLDEKGYITTPLSTVISPSAIPASYFSLPTSTSVPGIFAAGDCVDPRYRQAITAAGYGCMAALDAQKWLETTLEK